MMDLDVGHFVRTGETRSRHHDAARRMITRLVLAIASGEDLTDEAVKDEIAEELLNAMIHEEDGA